MSFLNIISLIALAGSIIGFLLLGFKMAFTDEMKSIKTH